jgi:hypothetical protein
MGLRGTSSWLVALGTLCVLASGAAQAADHARSAPGSHRGASSAAHENAPLLVRDPASGAVIKIWSRSDAFSTKIAWARNDGAGFGAPHDLTFGPSIDREPAVSFTSAGAWLFWRDDRGEVFYAPIDLGSGRLFGAPAHLAMGGVSGGVRPEGGNDVPVTLGNCDSEGSGCILIWPTQPSTTPGIPLPSPPRLEGGNDVPVTFGSPTSTGGSNLISTSDPTCERQLVTVVQGGSLLVAELDGTGRVRSHRTVRIGKGVKAEVAGPEAADFFMTQTCGH